MDILKTKEGDSIRLCTLGAGRNHHRERIEDNLQLGETYKVDKLIVGDWHTDVYLRGYEKPFNSVFFENI